MDAPSLIARLEEALGLKNDRSLAEYLGVGPSVISNWKSRGISNYDLIFTKCENVDLNWVIRGEKYESTAEATVTQYRVEVSLLKEQLKKLEEQNNEYWGILKQLIVVTDR